MENRGVIVLADGDFPTSEHALGILESGLPIVCCDGAVDKLDAYGLEPMAVVGDCDSMSELSAQRFAPIIHRDPDQDTNDLTKAVAFCVDSNFEQLTILGATGGREDHTLGNISLLLEYLPQIDVRMVSDYGEFRAIDRTTTLPCRVGDQVSIFNIDPLAHLEYRGLKYRLPEDRIRSWWSGTLNECVDEEFTIITSSPAIIYRPF